MSESIQKIRKFIEDKHNGPINFEDSDDLIENGLIDSLQFVEFVLLVAELSGKEIALDALNIDEFRSISAIQKAFFEDDESVISVATVTSARPVTDERI